eukprot:Gb_23876 [translate_table: standard]
MLNFMFPQGNNLFFRTWQCTSHNKSRLNLQKRSSSWPEMTVPLSDSEVARMITVSKTAMLLLKHLIHL